MVIEGLLVAFRTIFVANLADINALIYPLVALFLHVLVELGLGPSMVNPTNGSDFVFHDVEEVVVKERHEVVLPEMHVQLFSVMEDILLAHFALVTEHL